MTIYEVTGLICVLILAGMLVYSAIKGSEDYKTI